MKGLQGAAVGDELIVQGSRRQDITFDVVTAVGRTWVTTVSCRRYRIADGISRPGYGYPRAMTRSQFEEEAAAKAARARLRLLGLEATGPGHDLSSATLNALCDLIESTEGK